VLPHIPPVVISGASAVLGALVGSFLNVCIYRLPRDLSVRTPARSYCPNCRKTIPWWENVPILSWLLLRGRCSTCKQPISPRYLLVELLTSVLFWSAALKFGPVNPTLLLPYFVLLGILIVATFVDLEHMIIPDQITWGGVAAGAAISLAVPALHGASSASAGLAQSLLGAGAGYGLLWAVVELGRLAFGRKRTIFQDPTPAVWVRNGDEAELIIGDEMTPWGDFFFRGNEKIRMGVCTGEIDGRPVQKGEVVWTLNQLTLPDTKLDLNQTDRVSLQIEWIVLPREAMGFGDVKFLAAIGAFLGWKATLFTVMAASLMGAFFGVFTLLIGRRGWAAIPFGPYLAAGALLWVAAGPAMIAAYWQLIVPGR
jgi:leader peptidase (prepilin peptidase)/N-methyltransferase